jgi:hypothetical protein
MVQPQPPDVNVLPPSYRPRRISLRTALLVVLVAVLLVGLIPVYSMLREATEQTGDVEDRLAIAGRVLAAIEGEQSGLLETEERIQEVQSEIDQLAGEFGVIGQESPLRSDAVAAAVGHLVPRIHIDSIVQIEDTVVLQGEAGSQALVLDYSNALLTSGEFANVRILSMVNADPLGLAPDVSFSISLEG